MKRPALYDHEAERAALCVLIDESAVDVSAARTMLEASELAGTDFHSPPHSEVFAAVAQLLLEQKPADMETLAVRGTPPRVLASIMEKTGTAHSFGFPEYARALRDLATRRRAVAAAEASLQAAADMSRSVDAILAEGAELWAGIGHKANAARPGTEYFMALLDELDRAQKGEVVTCIPTGIDVWDQILGGVGAGELCFIGAQPGVGKSSLVASMLWNWAGENVTSAIFSLEDLGTWLPKRFISREAGVPLFVLANRPLTVPQMERVEDVSPLVHARMGRMHIDERSLVSADTIVQQSRALIVRHGVRVIVVDHLGKVDHEWDRFPGRPDMAIASTLNKFAALAKSARVPVVVVAHMKDRAADAKWRRPSLGDFAGAAAIERDARRAVGLYLDKDDPDILRVAVLKQTNGAADVDFAIRRLAAAGLVHSRNGKLQQRQYEDDERALQAARQSGEAE